MTEEDGSLLRHYAPLEITKGDAVFDLLAVGFQRMDEDRLRERIEPLVARFEASGSADVVECDAIAQLEEAVSDLDLSPAARMRVRLEAVDLIEGRLEAGDFVARTAARQECYRLDHSDERTHRRAEYIEL